MTGQYKSLCDHSVLSADEAAQVEAAERAENRRTCMTGLYPSLCDRSLLSEEDRQRADAAEETQQQRAERVPRGAAAQSGARRQTMPASGSLESYIVSDFDGLDYGNLYELANGQIWQQTEAWIWVWVWVYPRVLIWNEGGVLRMKVEGIDHPVAVTRIK